MSSEAAAAPFKKSTFRTKVKNPMIPLLILVSLISSALIKIAASQQEYDALTRNGESKIKALNSLLRRLEDGEEFDVQQEIAALNSSDADKSLEEIMKEIERAETEWMVTNPKEVQVEKTQDSDQGLVPVSLEGTEQEISLPDDKPQSSPVTRTSKFL